MQTSEIVRRLLSRPVTKERALKVLHLLETPGQVHQVIAQLLGSEQQIVKDTLTESVVQAHFARRAR